MSEFTHLDLFSGIGGFALAVDTVWPGAEHIFCEIDPFCCAVLEKHWPGRLIINDIRKLDCDSTSERRGEKGERERRSPERIARVDLKLQPAFVEWMQGYPLGWTDLSAPLPATGSKDLSRWGTLSCRKSWWK